MATHKSVKRPPTSAPGVKLLIAAASVAATLGGWALISSDEKPSTAITAPAQPTESVQAALPAVRIKLEPLPTLVPAITPQSQAVTLNRPRAVNAAQPAAAPQPAPVTELVLRDVSAPALASRSASGPAPVVTTRSSR